MEENYSYLHFTSNEAFESIIRSQTFRLYNYASLNDKFEISLPQNEMINEIFDYFNQTEQNGLLFYVFCTYLNFMIPNFEYDLHLLNIEEILDKLTKNRYLNNYYLKIYNLNKKRNYINNDNVGNYLSSFYFDKRQISKNYHTHEQNVNYNKNKLDIKSNKRYNSDLELNYLWDKYAKGHKGVSLKYDDVFFTKISDRDNKFVFKNVKYEPVDKLLINYEDSIKNKNFFNINKDILELSTYLLKELKSKDKLSINNSFEDFEQFKKDFNDEFTDLETKYKNKLTNLINSKIPFLKMETYRNESEYRLSVTKNINDENNIKNFKTDRERNTTFYELDFKDIFNEKYPLEVIIGHKNEKFLNTSYRETFQREFPFVKFLL